MIISQQNTEQFLWMQFKLMHANTFIRAIWTIQREEDLRKD